MITNKSEAQFLKTLEESGKLWFYQPRSFYLHSVGRLYRPDFYVVEDACFYEVLGSRQAYSYQRTNIDAFRDEYSEYRLEIVNLGAWKNGPSGPRVSDPDHGRPRGATKFMRRLRRFNTPIAERLVTLMERHALATLSELSRKTGVPYATIYSRVCEARSPDVLDDVAKLLEA